MSILWINCVLVLLQLYGTEANCNGSLKTIDMKNGDIEYMSSPGYPFVNYPRNARCQWRYRAKNDDTNLKIEVHHTDFEGNSNTCNDYLSVYEGTSNTAGIQLWRFCGRHEPRTFETDDKGSLYIYFHSDNVSSNISKGFSAKVLCQSTRFPLEYVLPPIGVFIFIAWIGYCHIQKKRKMTAATKKKVEDKKKSDAAAAKKKADEEAKKKADEEAKKKTAEDAEKKAAVETKKNPKDDKKKTIAVTEKKTEDRSTSPIKNGDQSTTVSIISSANNFCNPANICIASAPFVPNPSQDNFHPLSYQSPGNVTLNFNHLPHTPVYNPLIPENLSTPLSHGNIPLASDYDPPPYKK